MSILHWPWIYLLRRWADCGGDIVIQVKIILMRFRPEGIKKCPFLFWEWQPLNTAEYFAKRFQNHRLQETTNWSPVGKKKEYKDYYLLDSLMGHQTHNNTSNNCRANESGNVLLLQLLLMMELWPQKKVSEWMERKWKWGWPVSIHKWFH